MNDFEPSDELWKLLGKAKKPAVSPFFARNVLRQIRQQEEKAPALARFIQSFRAWRFTAVTAVATVILVAGAGIWYSQQAGQSSPPAAVAQQFSATPDYEVIVQLDDLLAYEENSVWLEPSTY